MCLKRIATEIASAFLAVRATGDFTGFCEHGCKFYRFPKSDGVDVSRYCRTFVSLHCTLKKKMVHKNLRYEDKHVRKQ
jgi:hypothetical protein